MCKQEFLDALRKKLSGLPKQDIEEHIDFYSEIIDDRTEDGVTEKVAVSEIGSVDKTASRILSEIPLAKIVKEKIKQPHTTKVWIIALLALGSPIWLSLLIAAVSVYLSLYVVMWSLVISLWAIDVSFAAGSVAGVVSLFVFAFTGNLTGGLALLAAGIFCMGLSVFQFFACKAATKGCLWLTKKITLGIKYCFIRKEKV